MSRLPMTIACRDYPYTHPLATGAVEADGIDLNMVSLGPAETFWRQLRHSEFDASELSLSNYMMSVNRSENRFVAIPVFPLRIFRHGFIWINTDAGIKGPEDLRGKRVGIPEYAMTALLFIRGMLHHQYGVAAQDITWVRQRVERVSLNLPNDIRVEQCPKGESIDAMLERGEIQAIISMGPPEGFRAGSPRIRRLFEDTRKVEEDYFAATRIFPIMHVLAIRQDVYERNTWVAQNLAKGFSEAKQLFNFQLWNVTSALSFHPWLTTEIENAWRFFGGDPYPYGVEANRPTLEAAMQYSFEQGLTDRRLGLEELFASETLDAFEESGETPPPTAVGSSRRSSTALA